MIKRLFCIYTFLILSILSGFCSSIQDRTTNDEILFICSYNSEAKYTYSSISQFIDEYMNMGGQYSPVVESMDCNALNTHQEFMPTMQNILEKHPNARLVILLGPEACVCYFSLTDEKYKKLPVYCLNTQRYCAALDTPDIPAIYMESGSEDTRLDMLELMKGFNVKLYYYYEYGVKEDIQFIHYLFPETRNIAIISDNSYSGLSQMRSVRTMINQIHPEIAITHIDGRSMDMPEALQAMKGLPDNTAIMLCIWRYDRKNIMHISNAEYAFRKTRSNLPVFSLTGSGIGYWAIGGNIPQYEAVNYNMNMAKKAYKLLDEATDTEPDFYCYPNHFKIDMNLIKEFQLQEKELPDDAQYINDAVTWLDFIQQYKWYIALAGSLLIVLIAGFIVSISYSMRLTRAKMNLEKSDAQLRQEKQELEESERNLRIAKDKAEEANRLKSKFVSSMSHEIRTPLNAIVGFSNVLASAVENNKELTEYVHIIYHNSDLLLKLINDVLDIASLENDNLTFQFEECPLVPYCQSILDTFRNGLPEGVELRLNAPAEDISIVTDHNRFQQILINLINNAIKFTEKGYIELSVSADEKKNIMVFALTDTGCGIPPEKHDHVFERFSKLNEYKQGTGLGLAITKIIIDKLGGDIRIDKDYRQGARFIFTLPLKREE